jgi:hypothetical protein
LFGGKGDAKVKLRVILLVTSYCVLVILTGCDAFVKKFTRKPKTENLPTDEMVVAPQEYKRPERSKSEQYQQSFLFWKTWQDELIVSLQEKRSQKKYVDCLNQAVQYLESLRPLLKQEVQQKLDQYIVQERKLSESLSKDFYGHNISRNLFSAERIKRSILRDFSYKKIKDFLIETP